ncbi:hypothetical protein ACQW02_02265 [Humitalea sp. 24SJ18S-53]|uniref:hypothetical protein n=1 Tax=Humitalea sp. 24SJ18S-53 TaxID=3422307 RepID=UPI003D6759B8
MDTNPNTYTDQAQAEIAALRAKVEKLMAERVTPALAHVAEQGAAAANAATDTVRDQAARVEQNVREHPFAALGIAALAGFVIAHLMRR